jgi:hypothetical protein
MRTGVMSLVRLVVVIPALAGCIGNLSGTVKGGESTPPPGGAAPGAGQPTDPQPPPPFEAVSPAASAAKVKDLLTGLPCQATSWPRSARTARPCAG